MLFEHRALSDFFHSLVSHLAEDYSFRPTHVTEEISSRSAMTAPEGWDDGSFNKRLYRYLRGVMHADGEQDERDRATSPHAESSWVFPTVQLGAVGARWDERATLRVLDSAGGADAGAVWLSSPYFNITKSFQEALLGLEGDVTVLTASPAVRSCEID